MMLTIPLILCEINMNIKRCNTQNVSVRTLLVSCLSQRDVSWKCYLVIIQQSANSQTTIAVSMENINCKFLTSALFCEPKVCQLWKKLTTTEDLSHDDTDTTASLADFGNI